MSHERDGRTRITTAIGDRIGLDRTAVLWGLLVVDLQILLVALYPMFPAVGRISNPLILLFPLVWIDVGLWAIASTEVRTNVGRTRYLALGIGIAYFLGLAYVGGLVKPGHAFHGHAHEFGFRWAWPLPPGWGPAAIYAGKWIGLNLIPYKLVGYASLAYLVYARVLDASGTVLAGAVGLFSCVSCTLPVIAMAAATVFGGASAVTAAALNWTYLLSTAIFLASVALLKWRPRFGVSS